MAVPQSMEGHTQSWGWFAWSSHSFRQVLPSQVSVQGISPSREELPCPELGFLPWSRDQMVLERKFQFQSSIPLCSKEGHASRYFSKISGVGLVLGLDDLKGSFSVLVVP